MNKIEFLYALREQFKRAHVDDVNEIIAIYDEHFIRGREQGLSEEAIIASLGTPEEIYEAYKAEGLLEETSSVTKMDVKGIVNRAEMTYKEKIVPAMKDAQEQFKEKIQPQMPQVVKTVSETLLTAGYAMSYFVGIITWLITIGILSLLLVSWQPFAAIPPLPPVNIFTFAFLGGTGFFGGLLFVFMGYELKAWKKRNMEARLEVVRQKYETQEGGK